MIRDTTGPRELSLSPLSLLLPWQWLSVSGVSCCVLAMS
jgi:hypothetical protein